MATWDELNAGARDPGTAFDFVRRTSLRQRADRTTLLLFSGWLDLII